MFYRVAVMAFILSHTVLAFGQSTVNVGGSSNSGPIEAIAHSPPDGVSYANLNSGILMSHVTAPANGLNSAFAEFSDKVTFNPGLNGIADLAIQVGGTIGPFTGANDYALLSVIVTYSDTTSLDQDYLFTNGSCSGVVATSCASGTSFDTVAVVPFEIRTGPTLISVYLASAVTGATIDFTDNFYLNVPSGANYSSASGEFLAAATPIAAVPEPEDYAMLAAGLSMLGWLTRRRDSVFNRVG